MNAIQIVFEFWLFCIESQFPTYGFTILSQYLIIKVPQIFEKTRIYPFDRKNLFFDEFHDFDNNVIM